jgi:hypothetical protein
MRTQTLSILISDLQGYTERQARSSRASTRVTSSGTGSSCSRYSACSAAKSSVDGRRVPGLLREPDQCRARAMQVQKQLASHNRAVADLGGALRVRIGIATGEVTRMRKATSSATR